VTDRERRTVAVIAVDGGNSKTDLSLVGWDGRVLGTVRGETVSHQQVGLTAGIERLRQLAAEAARAAGIADATAAVGAFALAGADTPADDRRLHDSIGGIGIADATVVVNDAYAPVWAGSGHGVGVGVICGAGVNAAGIAPDGRTARLAALGGISGDWGGGSDIGLAALGAAVRARDGRGPRTSLEEVVPRHFGFTRPIDLTMAIEHGRLHQDRLRELSPIVFDAAVDDAVARGILDRLADELAMMGVAIIRRLQMIRLDVDVTLAGGVFQAADPAFEARIATGIRVVAHHAKVTRLDVPPVFGAGLLGLDALRRSGQLGPADADSASERLRRDAR
jgi:N-acetylglucosamine kinase-like BadF-type ATPase